MSEPYILLINGPNLNRLGQREPSIYGSATLDDVISNVESILHAVGIETRAFQSNHEGALIDYLQQHGPGASGIIINPGAFAHYAYGLRDCLADVHKPTVEVHISNVHKREPFRHQLVLADIVEGQVVGLGVAGYEYAAHYLCRVIRAE